jgi:hypothetical protein
MAPSSTPQQRSIGYRLGLALLSGVTLLPVATLPVAALAADGRPDGRPGVCGGTLLQLQVEQRGTASFDRFRFDLGLQAEGASQNEAMDRLNQRLAALRLAITPLVRGDLTIPAPSTYRTGGGTGPGATPIVEHAGTSVTGVVSKASYDTLIQTAARLPGARSRQPFSKALWAETTAASTSFTVAASISANSSAVAGLTKRVFGVPSTPV